jgi:hypothetical protein
VAVALWGSSVYFRAGAEQQRLTTVEAGVKELNLKVDAKAHSLAMELAAEKVWVDAIKEKQDERIGKVEGAVIQQTEQYRFIRESIERIERRNPR